ncbi:MAG: amidohydrolase family protein [Desulfovibrio sp.]|nr:amidohydrolase family protein [Desulfovibrio sp.]
MRDLGDVTIIPGCVNAHTHLQLSHLAGTTTLHQGFVPWLASLVPLLRLPPNRDSLPDACADIAGTGTVHVGDICGSLPSGLADVAESCGRAGLGVTHFCEWFGHGPPLADGPLPWPPTCREEVPGIVTGHCAPACHSLYATSPGLLADVRACCRQWGLPFAMHLAESPEETLMLTEGAGALADFLRQRVLPADYRAPGRRPLAYARELDLLGPGTLAVHGVQLDRDEIGELGASGSALCLCPRSNDGIGVGLPDVPALLESGTLLCLGTDGLSSAPDLDVRNEAVFLRKRMDTPPEALIRLLTVNGAAALGLEDTGIGVLDRGHPARFAILPKDLEY